MTLNYASGQDEIIVGMDEIPIEFGNNILAKHDIKTICIFLEDDVLLKEYEFAPNDSNYIVIKNYNKSKKEIKVDFSLTFKEFENDTANNNGPSIIRVRNGHLDSEIYRFGKVKHLYK